MKRPVADLHCDLLSYLACGEKRSAYDKVVRCSIPQLLAGNVCLQTLAVFAPTTDDSSREGMKQVECFKKLPQMYPDTFEIVNKREHIYPRSKKEKIGITLAIENASCLCSERENFSEILERISEIEKNRAKIIYISLTWNGENRFGGGCHSKMGLKNDGMRLLEFLDERKIAVDLSHASDPLAQDILDYIDQNSLNIPVIASHSNMRSVENAPRNLPDNIVKEILKRRGVIGLNFFKPFIGGKEPGRLVEHITHIVKLGGGRNLCFGADFFYDQDIPNLDRYRGQSLFFPELDSAASYPHALTISQKEGAFSEEFLDYMAFDNVKCFLKNKIFS